MLVTTRKEGEVLVVGEARVKVITARGGKVTLAVQAPPEVVVRRDTDDKRDAESAQQPAR